MLREINEQLEKLYCTHERNDVVSIGTWYTIEGDPVNFYFTLEDDKYVRITTNEIFSEWIASCTGDWRKATPTIERLASMYAVQWDPENGRLCIRFRRNEMTLAQAVMRLLQAVFVVGSLGPF